MIGVAKTETHESDRGDLREIYLQSLSLIERLHRQLLDVIKDDFERGGDWDINSVQALLLFNIGDQEMTAGELRSRGHYLGSNVSYNLKKLVDSGYIHHQRSDVDRRSVRVRLTEAGREVHDRIDELFSRQLSSIEEIGGIGAEEFDDINTTLIKLERFWADQIRYRL
jgi:DNA-binding MarR family transcriptional regulator